MDAVVTGLIREGGGWLTSAVLLVVLAGVVKAGQMLLRREWDRGDRQDATIAALVATSEKLLGGQERMERVIEGLRARR